MIRSHLPTAALLCALTAGCTALPHQHAAPPASTCPPPAWQGLVMADLTQPASSRTYLFPDGTTCTVDLASP